MVRRPLAFAAAVLFAAVPLAARVISYAPYTDRVSVPAMGLRLNRHFAVVETSFTSFNSFAGQGQIVLYDSKGEEEPRVIYPQDGSEAVYETVVVRERGDEPTMILAVTSAAKWLLSADAGKSWKTLSINNHFYGSGFITSDTGGPYARGRYSNVRIGTPDYPFVAVTSASDGYRLIAIGNDGTTKVLALTVTPIQLLGSDVDHNRFLIRNSNEFAVIDLNGTRTFVGPSQAGNVEGWLTSAGAYVEVWQSSADIALWFYSGDIPIFVAGTYDKSDPTAVRPAPSTTTNYPFFAVPSANYESAWIIKRGTGAPTQLLEHHALAGNRTVVTHWSDITGPEVEAIHPSVAGDKVLIQVHRQRRNADTLQVFKDPALAVWHVGTPAPKSYDELYLAEQTDKGFVHLDVDKVESGDTVVFDSGRTVNFGSGGGVSAGGGGGGDVLQEWGVVRAALAQHLVLPGFGRTAGAFGSLWRSDLTLSNPNDAPVKVTLRFAASGDGPAVSETRSVRIELAPRELRLVPDAAKVLFGMEGGVGALFIDPDTGASINATGRTYTQSSAGTYGYGMNAIDIYAAASSRFPVTFAAAFQGPDFRTNFFMTDVSGRGSAAAFTSSGPYGDVGVNALSLEMSPFGVLQRNGLGALLGLAPQTIGALTLRPTRGEAVAALFSIDNRTNDSTFFPPDLSSGTTRTIPVIGHLAGANGSEFRSDLFLYNTASSSKAVLMEMRSWTAGDFATVSLTLLPHEARMIPDVLKSLFNRTGQARLRVLTTGTAFDSSVRLTSRTYTVDAGGGTYGFLMPPLNSFQSATTGDTLEILGTAMDPRFRTNLGLVDVTGTFSGVTPRARIDVVGTTGTVVDSFETAVPTLGGVQLGDLFRARSLAQDGAPVLLRITPLQGMIGAYAAMVDNASNDPMYFAANLAAK